MCGRSACNQCRETYQKAASYFDEKNHKYVQPEWKEHSNSGKEFKPSCNIAPTDITPVLLSGHLLPDATTERVLHPMMWGVIPPWHKGSYNSHRLSTNNCRIEGLSRPNNLYVPLLQEGKRCVVICDGFYEWQTTTQKKTKQPYFIYSKQESETLVEDQMSWLAAEWNSTTGWNGPRLLYMAGLYSVWQSPEGGEIYSYTVITKESKKDFSWLHHRVPAILSTSNQVQEWMDSKNVSMSEALKTLESVEDNSLSWHPVSTLVNNSSHKSDKCNKRMVESEIYSADILAN